MNPADLDLPPIQCPFHGCHDDATTILQLHYEDEERLLPFCEEHADIIQTPSCHVNEAVIQTDRLVGLDALVRDELQDDEPEEEVPPEVPER